MFRGHQNGSLRFRPHPAPAEVHRSRDKELATGEKGNFRFTLLQSPNGYSITAVPMQALLSDSHTYYSDQSMQLHYHTGLEPATASDPLAGQKEQQQDQTAKQ
jgi:hypothetical protein